MNRTLRTLAAIAAIALPVAAQAQAGFYPAMQPTTVQSREYNFALADFDGGSVLLFQWREGLSSPRTQFTADLGVADVGASSGIVLGGSFHYQLTRANADLPFDMVFGAGLGLTAIEDVSFVQTMDNPGLYAVSVEGKRGVVVGDSGAFFVSDDGGNTRTRRALPNEYRLTWVRDASLAPTGRAFLVGAAGFAGSSEGDTVTTPAQHRTVDTQ